MIHNMIIDVDENSAMFDGFLFSSKFAVFDLLFH